MGREVKRVPLDFDVPLQSWSLTHPNPHDFDACPACDGYGSTESLQVFERLVGSLLMLAGADSALKGVIHHPYFRSTPIDGRKAPRLHEITAGLAGRPPSMFGHDATDTWGAAAKIIAAAGLPDNWGACEVCGGDGVHPEQKYLKKLYEEWEEPEVPSGPGWQLWQTVSDGPITPVFETPEGLADYLVDPKNRGCGWKTDEMSRETWLKFITGPGWCMTAVSRDGGPVIDGVIDATTDR